MPARTVLTRATCRDTPSHTVDSPRRLKRLFEDADPRGVNPEHVQTLRDILATIHAAPSMAHLNQPGLRLHPLKGQRKGFWSITVRANWRLIFRYDDGVEDIDYVDYH